MIGQKVLDHAYVVVFGANVHYGIRVIWRSLGRIGLAAVRVRFQVVERLDLRRHLVVGPPGYLALHVYDEVACHALL